MILEHNDSTRITHVTFRIAVSLALATVLMLVAMPEQLIYFRPNFVVLVLIYWSLHRPQYVGLTVAFLVGLVLDIINFTLIGHYILPTIVVVYMVVRFGSRIRSMSVWMQTITVWGLLMLDLGIFKLINEFFYDYFGGFFMWAGPITGALMWLFLSLYSSRKFRRK